MPPRARAVVLPVALAAWLAPFPGGCCAPSETAAGPAALTSPRPDIVTLRYVTWKVEPKKDFQRISEYFDGTEDTGGDTYVRTHPDDRRGLYFILALEWSTKLPHGAVAAAELVSSESSEPKKHLFFIPPVAKPAHLREIRLGITGADWPDNKKATPVAWKITLRDPRTLEVLATAQSYLWSLDTPGR